jgi:hypothetical protein
MMRLFIFNRAPADDTIAPVTYIALSSASGDGSSEEGFLVTDPILEDMLLPTYKNTHTFPNLRLQLPKR